MNITVIGATGSVGRPLVEQALAGGDHVTAYVRDPSRVTCEHERMRVAVGQLTDAAALEDAVRGQDAVVITLGNGRKGDVRTSGTRAVVAAMRATDVARLVVLSTIGVGDSRPNLDLVWRYVMFGALLRQAYADHVEQEGVVRASGLDWTVVRAGALTDGPATGEYQQGFGPQARTRLKISRDDLAGFILEQTRSTRYLRATPAISY